MIQMPPKHKSLTHEAGCADISQSVTPANAKKPRVSRVVKQRSEHGEPQTFSILPQLSVSLQSLLLVLKSGQDAHHALGKAVGARFSSSIISSKFKQQRTPAVSQSEWFGSDKYPKHITYQRTTKVCEWCCASAVPEGKSLMGKGMLLHQRDDADADRGYS